MLKKNGHIYKPGIKEDLFEREKSFYEKIKTSDNEVYKALMRLTPEYFGSGEFTFMKKRKLFQYLFIQSIGVTLAFMLMCSVMTFEIFCLDFLLLVSLNLMLKKNYHC